MSMKKKVLILWIIFVVCLISTIGLWFAMNNQNLEYEEVQVTVVSAKTERVKNKKTGSSTDFYKVEVRYNGKTYDLENAHNTYMYPEGKTVKSYLANDRLFADTDGVKTSTPVSTVYFIFLFGSFIMLFVAATYSGKLVDAKKASKEEVKND